MLIKSEMKRILSIKKNKMNFKKLQEKINISFHNSKILETVFTHKSFINEAKTHIEHNERLEFLGDAVLELVVTEYLYTNFPNPEGDLTNWRAALVRGKNLAKLAKDLDLGSFLRLSKGEEKSGGREKGYILANTFEALIGAIYLDSGFETAKKFINKHVTALLSDILRKKLHIDAKSYLQEKAQDKNNSTPEYKLINEEGPAHEMIFEMAVYLNDNLVGRGKGSSKQKAEQQAAMDALKQLGWQIEDK